MRRIPYLLIGTILVFYGWHHFRETRTAAIDGPAVAATPEPEPEPEPARLAVESPAKEPEYRCDGRVYCREMHSCEEAKWFLQHCAGTKMDGDGDGIPCEDQYCGH